MKPKLKIFDSKKRFEKNKKLEQLENSLDHYNDERMSEYEKFQIMLDVLQEIDSIEEKDDVLDISGRQIRLIKKLEANIVADGGFQKNQPGLLLKYIKTMESLLKKNYKKSIYVDAMEDIKDMHLAVIGKELQNLLKNCEEIPDNFMYKEQFDELLWNVLESELTLTEGELPHFDTINELLKKFSDIDLLEGKNIQQIPNQTFTKLVYALENTFYPIDDAEEKRIKPLQEKLTKIVSNYVADVCKDNSSSLLLIKIPAIMELYNIVSSDGFTYKEREYPVESGKEISRKILSLLPSGLTISDEEKEYMDNCSKKYIDEPVSWAEFRKFTNIYCKMLLNKIAKDNSREDSLLQYSDIILGQLGRQKSISPEMKKLARLVIYDYAKDIFNSTIKTQDIRVTMADELSNKKSRGFFSSLSKKVYIKPNFGTRISFFNVVATSYHERQHAKVDDDQKNVVYKSEIEYLANKLMTLWGFIPSLVINSGINYNGSAHEVNARLTEQDDLIAFMKRHGIDRLDSRTLDYLYKSQRVDMKLADKVEYIDNPLIHRTKEGVKGFVTQVRREFVESRFLDPDYEEKVFNREGYRDYRYEHGPRQYANYSNSDVDVSILDGLKVNVDKLFDRLALKHPELCKPGSYFSIEYNPDGKRKPFTQILEEMSQLDESSENDGKRKVYRHILTNEASRLVNPRQAFTALMNYKSTNPKNDEIVQLVVERRMVEITDKMINQIYWENSKDISLQYQEKGYEGFPYIKRRGFSYYEMASSMINDVLMRCYTETKEVEDGKREELSPFVKGLNKRARVKDTMRIKNANATVIDILKMRQERYDQKADLGTLREMFDGYIISVGDVAKMTYGETLKKAIKKIRDRVDPPRVENNKEEAEIK